MSFDPFEARLHFLQLLRKLNASLPSIQKVVAYAVKYGNKCGEDLWECITEECSKGSLNTRINILYFLDSLADASLTLGPLDAPYIGYISRDLGTIVERVVPDSREGVLNLKSARQILDSWRTRRILDPEIIDAALAKLESRKAEGSSSSSSQSSQPQKRGHEEAFSKNDIIRRMEEDRERHKRLRERIWILPIPPIQTSKRNHPISNNNAASPIASPFTPASPSSNARKPPQSSTSITTKTKTPAGKEMGPPPVPTSISGEKSAEPDRLVIAETALDVEFEQMWETTSDLNEEDYEKMREDTHIAGQEIPLVG